MRIGFHLHYKNNDLGVAAVRLADFASSLGHDVSIYSDGRRHGKVDPKWDKVVETEVDRHFFSWVKDVQILVSLEPFSPLHFQGAARNGCKIVMLASWDTIQEDLRDCYVMADDVICPSKQGAALLQESWSLKNCRHVPWDNGLPVTRKAEQVDANRIKVTFPIHGWRSGSTHPDILSVIWRTLHRCPFVDATLLYGSKNFNTAGFKAVKSIEKTFKATAQFRAHQEKDLTRDDILMTYGRSDLIAWASEQEGLAQIGLDALAMGTPVLAYDVAPQNEFLHDRKNSILAPCELTYNWLGVPWVKPNAEEFESYLVSLVEQPKTLGELRRFTRYGMGARREQFTAGWKQAFSTR